VAGSGESCAVKAEVVNISVGGVALQVTTPVPVGALLTLQLRLGEGEPVITTLASVVRTTTERDGARLVGCTFIHELSEEQVRQLL
jgi:hypothetical protein